MQQPGNGAPVSKAHEAALAEKQAFMAKEQAKTLRTLIEDLDKACSQVRRTVYVLRKELKQ